MLGDIIGMIVIRYMQVQRLRKTSYWQYMRVFFDMIKTMATVIVAIGSTVIKIRFGK